MATTESLPDIGHKPGRTTVRAPGLDGVRALAVLAVLGFHVGFGAASGGFLGVDVFFVLSGYLITDLLVARRADAGWLDLREFWSRRARRLLPALAAVLVTVTAAVAVIEPGQLAALKPNLVAAVTYSSNWYQALHHESYFASFGPPPPLQHLWSLAIEEQFYLVWPLVLALILVRKTSRRRQAAIAWGGAAASAILMLALYSPGDPSRVYYGTDTHAAALLIGCAVALSWPLRQFTGASRGLTRRLDTLGVAGLAILTWALGHFSGADRAVYPFGLTLAALAAACLISAAAAPGVIGAMLSWRPLRWLGIRSYGIYLWHWPVIALAAAVAGPGRAPAWLMALEIGLSISLAAASWRWIEAPILRDGLRATVRARLQSVGESAGAARQSPLRAFPAVAALAAVTVACTAGYGMLHTPAPSLGLQQQIATGIRVSQATQAGSGSGGAVPHSGHHVRLASPAAGRPASTAGGGRPAGTPASPAASRAASSWAHPRGRSTATGGASPSASPSHQPPAGGHGAPGRTATRKVPGSDVTAIGDSVMLAAAPQLEHALRGIYIDAQVSRQMMAGVAIVRSLAESGRLRPVVVFGLGTNGTVTGGEIRLLLRYLGPRRKLVLINTFVPRPWEHGDNAAIVAAARRHRNVFLANWVTAIEHRTSLLWSDGIHPRPPGAVVYARMVARAVQATRGSITPRVVTGRRNPVPFAVAAARIG